MSIKLKLLTRKNSSIPAMKCPGWKVTSSGLSVDAGQNPILLLRSKDGSLGGLLCVADTGYNFTGLVTDQFKQALDLFLARGWEVDRIECAIAGGADSAKWKISKLKNLTRACGFEAKELDLNGLFYRKIYFDPKSGIVEIFREVANPDHWSPAKANLSLDDSARAFSEGQAGGVVANATRFFRDKNVFAALSDFIISEHLTKGSKAPLHIWSSACSNGSETYSLAMFIHKHLQDLGARNNFMVFGTDINAHLVETAKAGIYQLIRSDLEKWRPYFERFGAVDGYNIEFGDEIKKHVSFRVFDLKNRPRKYKFRMIICANVFQYYDDHARRFFMENFISVLQKPGYIYVGHVADNIIEGLGVERIREHKLLYVK